MFLLDLFNNKSITLTDPNQTKIRKNLYEVGVGSKALDYGIKGKPTNLNPDTPFGIYSLDAGPLLGKQVTFEADNNGDPIFVYEDIAGGFEGYTRGSQIDNFVRGGTKHNLERRQIDVKRITRFLATPNGQQFIAKQAALQLLNPRKETRVFNGGVTLLAQVGSTGAVNFIRHGLIPTPASTDIGQTIADTLNLPSEIGGIGLRGDYISTIGNFSREKRLKTGDPGKQTSSDVLQKIIDLDISDIAKPKDPRVYQAGSLSNDKENNITKIDKLNELGITQNLDDVPKDMIPFRFEVMNNQNPDNTDIIAFRAFIDGYSDDFSANHNTVKYNGRAEEFYTYNSFKRSIGVNFKIAAQSRQEMKPLYQKLNYLMAQTPPSYSTQGRIQTPYMRLTMGDYFSRIPGVITSIRIGWKQDYTWEIKLDPEGLDSEMLILPHVLDVNVSFQPIHDFTPNNSINAPFISNANSNLFN